MQRILPSAVFVSNTFALLGLFVRKPITPFLIDRVRWNHCSLFHWKKRHSSTLITSGGDKLVSRNSKVFYVGALSWEKFSAFPVGRASSEGSSQCYFYNSRFPTSHLLTTSLCPRSLLLLFSVSPSARLGGNLRFYFGLVWLLSPCIRSFQPVS